MIHEYVEDGSIVDSRLGYLHIHNINTLRLLDTFNNDLFIKQLTDLVVIALGMKAYYDNQDNIHNQMN